MKNSKVVNIEGGFIHFNTGVKLSSNHEQDCCESHYLCFDDLNLEDFDGLEFDLTSDSFFKRIPDYGIELVPIKGFSVKIPGYGSNNGYYSSNLDLVLTGNGINKEYNITECQKWE